MQFKFDTDSVKHAKAALLLYAMYKSREKNSSLNGLETWNRFTEYIRGACLKSCTTAEFCNNFCHMAKVGSIKPCYLQTDGGIRMLPDGSLVQSDSIKDYKLSIVEDDELLLLYEKEGYYLTMLVRDRIEREKMEGTSDEN